MNFLILLSLFRYFVIAGRVSSAAGSFFRRQTTPESEPRNPWLPITKSLRTALTVPKLYVARGRPPPATANLNLRRLPSQLRQIAPMQINKAEVGPSKHPNQ
jgi:hypothetical protein